MKKSLLLQITTLFIISGTLSAQTFDFNNPQSEVYQNIEYWQKAGYLKHLPPYKPYPQQLIIEICETVLARSSDKRDLEIAEQYITEAKGPLRLETELLYESQTKGEETLYLAGPIFEVRGMPHEMVGLWMQISALGVYGYGLDVFPQGDRINRDIKKDNGKIDIADETIWLMQSSDALMTVGTSNVFFSAGITRSSFGNISGDSIILNPDAPHTGNFTFVWRGEKASFTSSFMELIATNSLGEGLSSEKYISLHSFNLMPANWLELSFFESVVYGKRIEPLYLVPFSELFYTQGFVGFQDNSLMGLSGRLHFPEYFTFYSQFYLDDFNFNEAVKFNFDSIQNKFAWQSELSRAFPELPFLKQVSVEYLAIMPYMYSHISSADRSSASYYATTNYQNYTHMGQSLGTSLSPNSDRVQLLVNFDPVREFSFDWKISYSRHGNGSIDGNEVILGNDVIPHDGSLFDDGYDNGSFAHGEARFLTQDILEKTFQTGIDASLSIKHLTVTVSYLFESIENSRGSNLSEPIEGLSETNHYIGFNTLISF